MIPLPGRPIAGGGLRAWGLGEALRARGHDVVYSVPTKLVPEGEEYDELREHSFDPTDLQRTLLRAAPDVLLVEQWGLATHLIETSLPVVLDLHGSLILENSFRRHRSLTSNAAAKIKAMQKADLVLCPARRQRAYFMPWMMMSGANPVELPVEVVPVSMPPELPAREVDFDGPLTLVYGGQLWPWIEPGVALAAATSVLEETGAGTLELFVNEPDLQQVLPYDNSTQIQAWTLPEKVKNSEVVKLEGRIPRDEMIQRYTSAHLAVDLYGWNTERELAFTTRTVEYMWCGLPVIYGDYGELAELIKKYEAGWLVSPDDPEGVRAALHEAVSDRQELRRRAENARRLVQEELTWDRTIDPLDRFVREPIIRDKGDTIFGKLALEFDRIKAETGGRLKTLEGEVKSLVEEVANRDNRIVTLTDDVAHQERRAENLEAEKRKIDALVKEAQIEVAEREREIRKINVALEEARMQALEAEAENMTLEDQLRCEQEDHGQTTLTYTRARAELGAARHEKEQLEGELEQLKNDHEGAVAKHSNQKSEFDAAREEIERKLADLGDRELALRKEVAAEAGRAEEINLQQSDAHKENERLRQHIKELQSALRELRNSWVERTVATGEHSVKRVAVQIPTLAGLFVRNLANNAYMTIWQKRHNVRIFPGQ